MTNTFQLNSPESHIPLFITPLVSKYKENVDYTDSSKQHVFIQLSIEELSDLSFITLTVDHNPENYEFQVDWAASFDELERSLLCLYKNNKKLVEEMMEKISAIQNETFQFIESKGFKVEHSHNLADCRNLQFYGYINILFNESNYNEEDLIDCWKLTAKNVLEIEKVISPDYN